MENKLDILFLFESSIPKKIDRHTLGFGELVTLASLPEVRKVVGIGRSGPTYYEGKTNKDPIIEAVHKKITTIQMQNSSSRVAYWLSPLFLFIHGFQYLKNQKASVIHAESCYLSGISATLLGVLFRKPVIIENHATYESLLTERLKFFPLFIKKFIWNMLSTLIYTQADCICANSKISAKKLNKLYPQCSVHWYIPAIEVPSQARGNHVLTIGYIGRLYPDKGPMYFLEALGLIKDQLIKRNIRVLIAGSGPESFRMTQFIKSHKLSMVYLLGTQNRWNILHEIDVLVNTTIVNAALEMVIIEAAACKIPTICFGDHQFPETVIHQKTGQKVPYKDIHALAAAIGDIIISKKRITNLGINAFIHYQTNYSKQVQIDNVTSMYKELNLIHYE